VPHPGPNGGPAVIDPLDVIKTTITVAGFYGAVLVGVYGYRKQRLVEGDANRADAEQLAQRYTTAADQLGHEKAAVRLAGVYAMARLADDWDDQRKVCIDVLCAYLRMFYDPDTTSEKHREGEREVRHTIILIIRDHLQDPDSPSTWCGRDLDLTDVTFDGGDFKGARFTGGNVSFAGATFAGGRVSFAGAKFTGGNVSFDRAKFTGGNVSFGRAKFTGAKVSFSRARFDGSEVGFDVAMFTGGNVSFYETEFSGGAVYFDVADFTGDDAASFHLANFTGGKVSFGAARFNGNVAFDLAKFAGGTVSFDLASFTGGPVSFDFAKFTGGKLSFETSRRSQEVIFSCDGAKFTPSCSVTWGPFEPPAAWTALQERERRQNEPPL
jgi:uncharacterized protein YjbI with pentapeptide repeats